MASWSPWITSDGQRSDLAYSRARPWVRSAQPLPAVANSTSALVCILMPKKWLISSSESASVKHWEKKNRRKSGKSRSQ